MITKRKVSFAQDEVMETKDVTNRYNAYWMASSSLLSSLLLSSSLAEKKIVRINRTAYPHTRTNTNDRNLLSLAIVHQR